MKEKQLSLLPSGFHDILPPDSGKRAFILHGLMGCFEDFGYMRVVPPLFEFEASLFNGSGKSQKQRTFRIMDPISQRMMGLRGDMTVQVARIANSRLAQEHFPLRLAYEGDVVRVKSSDLYGERQLTQAGIELVGIASAEAEIEIVCVAIDALTRLNVKGISIDFSVPRLTDLLCEAWNIRGESKELLLQAIAHKDPLAIRETNVAQAECFASLASPLITTQQAKGLLSNARAPEAAFLLLERLEQVMEGVKKMAPAINTTFDLVEARQFSYHSGVCFSIFSSQAKNELGRGGRYAMQEKKSTRGKRSKETPLEAVGLTIYANALFRIVQAPASRMRVFIPYGVSMRESADLRAGGYITVHGLSAEENVEETAKRLHCGQVFRDGKMVKISA